ncbi:MAG: iron-containing alcohol dehydrogenase [Terracidiphilus sp.]|jgi:alcohol dehydrogenase class IV
MSFTLALPRLSLTSECAMENAVAALAQLGGCRVLVLTDRVVRSLEGFMWLVLALDYRRFAQIATAMGIDTSRLSEENALLAAIVAIRRLSMRVCIPRSFASLGINFADVEAWFEPALQDLCARGNPRKLSADDVSELYTLGI